MKAGNKGISFYCTKSQKKAKTKNKQPTESLPHKLLGIFQASIPE